MTNLNKGALIVIWLLGYQVLVCVLGLYPEGGAERERGALAFLKLPSQTLHPRPPGPNRPKP